MLNLHFGQMIEERPKEALNEDWVLVQMYYTLKHSSEDYFFFKKQEYLLKINTLPLLRKIIYLLILAGVNSKINFQL